MISPLLIYTTFQGQSCSRLSQSARIELQNTADRGRLLDCEVYDRSNS